MITILKELLRKHREIGTLEDPDFVRTHRCHDWRNYIPDELQTSWKDLSYEARVVAYLVAKPHADRENWD